MRPATAKEVALRLAEAITELAVEEGQLDLASFLDDRFNEQRKAREMEVADAIAALDRPATTSIAIVTEPARTEPQRRWLVWGAVSTVAIAGLGAVAYFAYPREAPASEPVRAAPPQQPCPAAHAVPVDPQTQCPSSQLSPSAHA